MNDRHLNWTPNLNIQIHRQINEIPAQQWNKLIEGNNPFLRHEFLNALELHQCVGTKSGWIPCHIAIFEDDVLKAAMPMYQKYNSQGEFVFDHGWADAYHRNGIQYYPKLVSAVPYTPTLGQRFLCKPEDEEQMFPLLLQSAIQVAEQIEASSIHCLFSIESQHPFLEQAGLLVRHDCQYHWHNDNYTDFDDFLSRLSSRKRKNIKQERRKVAQAGIQFRLLDGHTASEEDWNIFNQFYSRTFHEKWNTPKFNLDFFIDVARQLPDQTFLVLADHNDQCVAGALMYRSDTHLYGRHWGSSHNFDSLHFEACYYQGIEYCIREKLSIFEPGAQGQHKISRGFIPTRTLSAHWIADPRFEQAIEQFCKEERQAMAERISYLETTTPYRKDI